MDYKNNNNDDSLQDDIELSSRIVRIIVNIFFLLNKAGTHDVWEKNALF